MKQTLMAVEVSKSKSHEMEVRIVLESSEVEQYLDLLHKHFTHRDQLKLEETEVLVSR
jgi:hypothetical protein